MKNGSGDIWDKQKLGCWICIPVNGVVNKDGRLVMGKGLAKDAAERYPALSDHWGRRVTRMGSVPLIYPPGRLISFPTKYHWKDPSPIELIAESAQKLVAVVDILQQVGYVTYINPTVYLPRVGCGEGQLDWSRDVLPVLTRILIDDFTIISPG